MTLWNIGTSVFHVHTYGFYYSPKCSHDEDKPLCGWGDSPGGLDRNQHRCDKLKSHTVISFHWRSFTFDLARFVDSPPQVLVPPLPTSAEHLFYPREPKRDKNTFFPPLSNWSTFPASHPCRLGKEQQIEDYSSPPRNRPCCFFCKNSQVHPPTIAGRHVVFCCIESFVDVHWTSNGHKNADKSWNWGVRPYLT